MRGCPEVREVLQLLVDAELNGDDRDWVLAHLQTCSDCQQELLEAEVLSKRIRMARPPITASQELRQRIEDRLVILQRGNAHESRREEHKLLVKRPYVLAIAAMLFLVFGTGFLMWWGRSQASRTMMHVALQAHDQLEQGQLPLDIETNSSQEVANWFAERVAFPFRMADAGIADDRRAEYRLVGGKLVNFRGQSLALVAFRLHDETVTLLAAPDSGASDTRGTVIRSGEVALHARDEEGMHIVSWTNRSLNYVLVSRKPMGNPLNCARCHRNDAANATTAQQANLLSKWESLKQR